MAAQGAALFWQGIKAFGALRGGSVRGGGTIRIRRRNETAAAPAC